MLNLLPQYLYFHHQSNIVFKLLQYIDYNISDLLDKPEIVDHQALSELVFQI